MDTNELISPVSVATIDFIYPMPTWKEREYIHSMFATTEEKIVCALIGIFSAYTFVLCVVMGIHRHSQHIRASSFKFSSMMGCGAIVGYLAILTWPIENNTSTCYARPWLWCLGFQLFFAPLLAKSYRIAVIFNDQHLQQRNHNDQLVIRHMICIMIPQFILLIIWSIHSPLQGVIRMIDPIRPMYNYADCDSEYAMIYTGLSVAYAGCCLLAGCLLAYRIRGAFEIFNDAHYIANSIYIFTLTSIIVTIVQVGINNTGQLTVIFLIRSIGTLIAYCGPVSLLLVPRVAGVLVSHTMDPKSSLNKNRNKHGSMTFGTQGRVIESNTPSSHGHTMNIDLISLSTTQAFHVMNTIFNYFETRQSEPGRRGSIGTRLINAHIRKSSSTINGTNGGVDQDFVSLKNQTLRRLLGSMDPDIDPTGHITMSDVGPPTPSGRVRSHSSVGSITLPSNHHHIHVDSSLQIPIPEGEVNDYRKLDKPMNDEQSPARVEASVEVGLEGIDLSIIPSSQATSPCTGGNSPTHTRDHDPTRV